MCLAMSHGMGQQQQQRAMLTGVVYANAAAQLMKMIYVSSAHQANNTADIDSASSLYHDYVSLHFYQSDPSSLASPIILPLCGDADCALCLGGEALTLRGSAARSPNDRRVEGRSPSPVRAPEIRAAAGEDIALRGSDLRSGVGGHYRICGCSG